MVFLASSGPAKGDCIAHQWKGLWQLISQREGRICSNNPGIDSVLSLSQQHWDSSEQGVQSSRHNDCSPQAGESLFSFFGGMRAALKGNETSKDNLTSNLQDWSPCVTKHQSSQMKLAPLHLDGNL